MRRSLIAACILAATCRVAFADVIAECNQVLPSEVRVLPVLRLSKVQASGQMRKRLPMNLEAKPTLMREPFDQRWPILTKQSVSGRTVAPLLQAEVRRNFLRET